VPNKALSKTDAIRRALQQNESPKEVAAVLAKQGMKVTAQYVSTIKSNDKRRAAGGKPSKGPGRPPKTASAPAKQDLQAASELLSSAMDLVIKCGGAQARQLVASAEAVINQVR